MSNSTIVFHRLVKFTLTDQADLNSPGFHKKFEIIPSPCLGWKKHCHLDSQFDRPDKSHVLTWMAINGFQARIKSKIIGSLTQET